MAEIVEPKAICIRDRNASCFCRRPQLIDDEGRDRQQDLARAPQRREENIRTPRMRGRRQSFRLLLTTGCMGTQSSEALVFGSPSLPLAQRFERAWSRKHEAAE